MNWRLYFYGLICLELALVLNGLAFGQDEKGRFIDDEYETAGTHLLRWSLHPGQKFNVVASQHVTQETVGPLGTSGKMLTELSLYQDWEVTNRVKKELKGNSLTPFTFEITVIQTVRRIKLMTAPPGLPKIEVDTELPSPNDPIAKQIHADLVAMVGQQIELIMNHRGQVNKYAFIERAASDEDNPQTPKSSSRDSVRSIAGQMVQFPETTARIGRVWDTTLKSNLPVGTSTVQTEYTFEGPLEDRPNLVRVTLKPVVQFTAKDPALSLAEQSSDGYLLYDLENRFVRETEASQKLVFAVGGDNPRIQHVDTTVRMQIDLLQSGN